MPSLFHLQYFLHGGLLRLFPFTKGEVKELQKVGAVIRILLYRSIPFFRGVGADSHKHTIHHAGLSTLVSDFEG